MQFVSQIQVECMMKVIGPQMRNCMWLDLTGKESQSQQHTMELVNDVDVDDEQNESDVDNFESGEDCFEGNGEQDQLGNQGDNADDEQDEDVIYKVGFVMHNVQGETETEENTQNEGDSMLQDETEDDASDEEQGYISLLSKWMQHIWRIMITIKMK